MLSQEEWAPSILSDFTINLKIKTYTHGDYPFDELFRRGTSIKSIGISSHRSILSAFLRFPLCFIGKSFLSNSLRMSLVFGVEVN